MRPTAPSHFCRLALLATLAACGGRIGGDASVDRDALPRTDSDAAIDAPSAPDAPPDDAVTPSLDGDTDVVAAPDATRTDGGDAGVACPGRSAPTAGFHSGVNTIMVPFDPGHSYHALLYLPEDYLTSTTCHPLLVFTHGESEAGTDINLLYVNGPFQFITLGSRMEFTNPADGRLYRFIVLAPQAPTGSATSQNMPSILTDVIGRFPVDTSRIYMTGLGAGGDAVYNTPERAGTDGQPQIAAGVPMSAAATIDGASMTAIVSNRIPFWGFGSLSDTDGINTQTAMNDINARAPGLARFTVYAGGHCCWNNFYDPTYRVTIGGTRMNIYEWMLRARHAP